VSQADLELEQIPLRGSGLTQSVLLNSNGKLIEAADSESDASESDNFFSNNQQEYYR